MSKTYWNLLQQHGQPNEVLSGLETEWAQFDNQHRYRSKMTPKVQPWIQDGGVASDPSLRQPSALAYSSVPIPAALLSLLLSLANSEPHRKKEYTKFCLGWW